MFKSRKSTAFGMEQEAGRKQSISTTNVRTQSAGEAPTQKMVKVAVIPPRLPPGVAPPTGLGPADTFSWQESINWSSNELISEQNKKKNFLQKAGLTTRREKANPDLPPFTFREVPYDVWRQHYAKDKDGNYHGTLAPAEDCILNPQDVAKWRLDTDEPVTVADKFTRGRHVLPVYNQATDETGLPTYQENESPEASRSDSIASQEKGREPSWTADGKTSEQIIAEAKERAKVKKPRGQQVKDSLKAGATYALLAG